MGASKGDGVGVAAPAAYGVRGVDAGVDVGLQQEQLGVLEQHPVEDLRRGAAQPVASPRASARRRRCSSSSARRLGEMPGARLVAEGSRDRNGSALRPGSAL